ncbi:hypothetical protein GW587_21755 [Duganella sp. SAP-35]|uniref:Uncharacterized protein n=1 Tax=Duganella aceris TaxID=2703883 RepID=A0ABX0FQF2_9BURK|nr:hypothetical protein [Duganella aceris]
MGTNILRSRQTMQIQNIAARPADLPLIYYKYMNLNKKTAGDAALFAPCSGAENASMPF